VLLVLVLIRWVGDAWWGITPLLFTPRWAFLLPLAALATASGVLRCFRHWWLQGAIALVVAWPLMGLGVPVFTLWPWQPRGERVRVATFNLGLAPVPTLGFEDWLKREKADVVCFQEGPKAGPIYEALAQTGWNFNRRKTIASRFPIVAELEPMPDAWDSEERYSARLDRVRLKTPGDREFVVASVHLPTIRPGFLRLMRGDVRGLTLHVAWWGSEMSRVLSLLSRSSDLPMVVGGDFNMPSDDSTMAALRNYFRFAFEEAGWGYGYTRPAEYPWVRIDHLLSSPEWSVTRCRVGPDLGSDHLPVIAEFVLPPAETTTGATPRDGVSGRAADR
jgi:endonuclease/exonuclease/phosphatase family metal-dependent hydrolase